MSRAVALALSFTVLAVAAPAVKPKAVYYHPTRVGDTRVYEFSVGDKTAEFTEEVTKVETKGDVFHVTTSRGAAGSTIEVSASGLVQRTVGGESLSPPARWLRLPAKVGETWAWQRDGSDKKTICTTGEVEDVEVPAGKFRAVRVDVESTKDGKRAGGATIRYAPEIGVVKLVSVDPGSPGSVQILKSFKPGK